MEVKVVDINAKTLGDAMGLTKIEMKLLAKRTADAYIEYVKDVFEEEESEVSDHSAENKLFFNVMKQCETIEQALFLAFHFKVTINAVLTEGLKTIITKN